MSQASDASQAKALEMKAKMERGRLPDGLGGIVTFDDNRRNDNEHVKFDYIHIGDIRDIRLVLDAETALTEDQRRKQWRVTLSNGRTYQLRVFARVEVGKFPGERRGRKFFCKDHHVCPLDIDKRELMSIVSTLNRDYAGFTKKEQPGTPFQIYQTMVRHWHGHILRRYQSS